jgi:hypothetical protein
MHSKRKRSRSRTRSKSPLSKKGKSPWAGWKKEKPGRHERTVMRKRCGSKCFLGPGTSFPICKKNTCTISPRGVYAAYVRGREWKHGKTVSRAKSMLKRKNMLSPRNKK